MDVLFPLQYATSLQLVFKKKMFSLWQLYFVFNRMSIFNFSVFLWFKGRRCNLFREWRKKFGMFSGFFHLHPCKYVQKVFQRPPEPPICTFLKWEHTQLCPPFLETFSWNTFLEVFIKTNKLSKNHCEHVITAGVGVLVTPGFPKVLQLYDVLLDLQANHTAGLLVWARRVSHMIACWMTLSIHLQQIIHATMF